MIHYLREKIIREKAPELYVKFDQTATYVMPENPDTAGDDAQRMELSLIHI